MEGWNALNALHRSVGVRSCSNDGLEGAREWERTTNSIANATLLSRTKNLITEGLDGRAEARSKTRPYPSVAQARGFQTSPMSDRFAGPRGVPCTHVGEGRRSTAQARAFPFPRSVRVRGRGSCSRSTNVVHTHHVSLDWDAARVYDRVKQVSTVAFRTDRSARRRGEASAHEIERHGGVSRAHVSLEGGRRA